MSELLIRLCFPIWIRFASTPGLIACRDHGVSKLSHLVERGVPYGVLQIVEDALNRIGSELDARAWKRATMRRVS